MLVIDSLNLDRPVLVGHSLGGQELSSIGSRHRIVQHKMSLMFPTQDEPESNHGDDGGTGHTAGECRLPCSAEHLTPTQMQQFLEAGATLSFAGTGRKPVYALIERTLRGCQYPALSKKDKGIVRRYLAKVSGLSRSQITRLIARWRERGVLEPRASRRRRFPRRYTPDDIARLAAVDAAHEGLSAPAIRRILERVQSLRQDRIPTISRDLALPHLQPTATRAYREHHVHHTKTAPRR